MGKREKELVALLGLASWCLVIVVWLYLLGAKGLSAVCDCDISRSYSLTIFGVIHANSHIFSESAHLLGLV